MTKQFVAQLTDKEPVQSIFLVREKSVLRGKNGKAYISLALCDRSGAVDGRIWDNIEEHTQSFQSGDFIRVKGIVQMFQNRRQVVVHRVEKADTSEIELKDFMAASAEDPEKMMARLTEVVQEIRDPFIKKLVTSVLEDPEIRPRLLRCPAAKSIHHAYIGGLLEHILSICEIMRFMAHHYPVLNLDLLIFGAIFHDIGKIWELEYEAGTVYTDKGQLLGHLIMAVELIEKSAMKITEFPDELKTILKHIVLSHHGKLEYGSPKTPQFLEALVVAFIDDFDSKMNTIYHYMQNERQMGERWSRYHQMFERYFYLGVSPDRAYPAEKASTNGESETALFIPQGHSGLSYKKSDS